MEARNNKAGCFALGLLAFAVSQAVYAAEDAQVLETVVISTSRSQSKVEEMPLHTTVISQEDIQKSPAQTVDQLLRNIPGMNFSGVPAAMTDPTGHSTKMRGMGTAKVLVLLDGVPIHDPFYLTTQWFKVPLSNIERIEVVRGGNSSWGSMAVAGVVNIISKRVKDSAGEIKANAGDYKTGSVAVSKNFMVSDVLSFSLAVDQFQTAGYQTIAAEYLWRYPTRQAPDAKDTNFQLTTYFKPSTDLNGFLRLGYHVQDQNLGYAYNNNLQESPDMAAGLTKTLDKSSSVSANVWAQYVRFEKYNGASCYYVGAANCRIATSTTLTTANINSPVLQYYSQYGSQRYREQGGSVAYSKNMEGRWSSFQLGADYRNLSAKDSEMFYATPVLNTAPQNFKASGYGQATQAFTGLFGQAKINPLDALELTFNGRYDSLTSSDRINQRTSGGVTNGGALPETTKSGFNPSVAARYELNNQVSLRGAAYKAFRAPGFNNTTRTYGSSTSTAIANPDLMTEDMTGWEMGTDYSKGGLSVGATYFLYNLKNMIGTYKVLASAASIPAQVTTICGVVAGGVFPNCENATSVSFYTNDQDGQSHGLELTGNWKIKDNLALDATYTHTETYLTRRGSVVTDPLGIQFIEVPKDVASLGATWKPTDKLRTYAQLRYIGPMLTDTTSIANKTYGQGGNAVYNASATYAWNKSMDLSASVVNLFNHQYSESKYNYDQFYARTLSMPRAINVSFKMSF